MSEAKAERVLVLRASALTPDKAQVAVDTAARDIEKHYDDIVLFNGAKLRVEFSVRRA